MRLLYAACIFSSLLSAIYQYHLHQVEICLLQEAHTITSNALEAEIIRLDWQVAACRYQKVVEDHALDREDNRNRVRT